MYDYTPVTLEENVCMQYTVLNSTSASLADFSSKYNPPTVSDHFLKDAILNFQTRFMLVKESAAPNL